jgi:hypothetical protein
LEAILMRTQLLAIGLAGLTVLPMQAGAWGGFRGGDGFHEGAGGFTSWHSAGWGGGGWGGAYHAGGGGVTHVGYGGVTHVGFDDSAHVGYGGAWGGAYHGGAYYHPAYTGGGCWGCVNPAGAAAVAGVAGLAAGAAIGSAENAWSTPVAYAAPALGSTVLALPGGCSSVFANGSRYYNCGSAYYQPQFGGNGVYYTVVPAPY